LQLLVRKQNNLRNMPAPDFHEQQALLPAAEVGEGGGGMQLLPVGGASMDSVISLPALNPLPIQSPDNIFKNMRALSSTITEDLANVTGQFLAKEAGGEISKLEGVSGGDIGNLNLPSLKELNVQAVGVVANTDTGRS